MAKKDFRSVMQHETKEAPYLSLSVYNFTPGRITLSTTNGGCFSSDVSMTAETAEKLAHGLLEMVAIAKAETAPEPEAVSA